MLKGVNMLDPTIAKMETLENCVKIDYFRGQLGWTMEQVSYELNFNLRRMMEWLNGRTAAATQLVKASPVKAQSIRVQLEKDYPKPKPEKAKKLKLDVNRVAKYLVEGKSLPEIAKAFHCKLNNYRTWHNENLRRINEIIKRMGTGQEL